MPRLFALLASLALLALLADSARATQAGSSSTLEQRLAQQRIGALLDLDVAFPAEFAWTPGAPPTTALSAFESYLAAHQGVLTWAAGGDPAVERALTTALRQRGRTLTVARAAEGVAVALEVTRTAPAQPVSARLVLDFPERARVVTPPFTFRAPTAWTLLPPLLAILVAVLFRRTVLALFAGVLVGAILVRARDHGVVESLTLGALDVGHVYLWERLSDPDNTRTIVFVVLMLSMVGLLVRSGGLAGVMQGIARRAQSARGSQIAAWFLGLFVFFDDYSNTVLVGSTMRPLCDKFRVAREKLAYIVDSTAAPVAGLSLFSTWIAFEVSTFAPQLPTIGRPAESGFAVFLETLPYRFYCIFTLLFVGLVVLSGRDFGPMRRAEARASRGELLAPGAKPMQSARGTFLVAAPGVVPLARRALVPLLAFMAVTIGAILVRGGALAHLAGAGDPARIAELADLPLTAQLHAVAAHIGALSPGALFDLEVVSGILLAGSGTIPLLLGSAVGFALAALACARAGVAHDIPRAAWSVLSSMTTAFAILYLAWMIGSVCRALETAPYLTAWIGGDLPPLAFPALLFLLASAIAFATGSSWSTMMILLPLVVGLAFELGETTALGGYGLVLMSIGAVLEGSIFGDHCSPLSDTTVLSSISSASDHIDHVRTQAPYAALTMAVAIGAGYLPCAYLGWSPLVSIALGFVVLVLALGVLGRPKPAASAPPQA